MDSLPWWVATTRQNDLLISSVATDLTTCGFHTQEIPGSHVFAATGGRADTQRSRFRIRRRPHRLLQPRRQADQVPVVYTQPKHVYKPKGALPGMVIYKHETVLWGQPRRIEEQGPQMLQPRRATGGLILECH